MKALITWFKNQPENVRDAVTVLLGGSVVEAILAGFVALGVAPWPVVILVLMMILATARAVYNFPSENFD